MDESHLAPLALTGRSSFHKNICRAQAVLLYLDLFVPDENSPGSEHVWPEFQTWAFSFSKSFEMSLEELSLRVTKMEKVAKSFGVKLPAKIR